MHIYYIYIYIYIYIYYIYICIYLPTLYAFSEMSYIKIKRKDITKILSYIFTLYESSADSFFFFFFIFFLFFVYVIRIVIK